MNLAIAVAKAGRAAAVVDVVVAVVVDVAAAVVVDVVVVAAVVGVVAVVVVVVASACKTFFPVLVAAAWLAMVDHQVDQLGVVVAAAVASVVSVAAFAGTTFFLDLALAAVRHRPVHLVVAVVFVYIFLFSVVQPVSDLLDLVRRFAPKAMDQAVVAAVVVSFVYIFPSVAAAVAALDLDSAVPRFAE